MKTLFNTLAVAFASIVATNSTQAQQYYPQQGFPQQGYPQRIIRSYEPVVTTQCEYGPVQPTLQPTLRCLPESYKDWSSKCYFPKHQCHGYYSQPLKEWFYFYPQKKLYVPVKYMDQLPPKQEPTVGEDPQLPPGAVQVDPNEPESGVPQFETEQGPNPGTAQGPSGPQPPFPTFPQQPL